MYLDSLPLFFSYLVICTRWERGKRRNLEFVSCVFFGGGCVNVMSYAISLCHLRIHGGTSDTPSPPTND